MTVKEFVESFGKDECISVNPMGTPGISKNRESEAAELLSLTNKIPALSPLIKAVCMASMSGDVVSEVAIRTIINMLILMHKKDSQEHIDKLLSTKSD